MSLNRCPAASVRGAAPTSWSARNSCVYRTGTVSTTSRAGVDFGFPLVWALVFCVSAAMLLQEMSARLENMSRERLREALCTTFRHPFVTSGAAVLVVATIAVGHSVFQTGNVTGAGLGLEALIGVTPQSWAGIWGWARSYCFSPGSTD